MYQDFKTSDVVKNVLEIQIKTFVQEEAISAHKVVLYPKLDLPNQCRQSE